VGVFTVTRTGDVSMATVGHTTRGIRPPPGSTSQPPRGCLPSLRVRRKTFTVSLLDDADDEGDELFALDLTNLPVGASWWAGHLNGDRNRRREVCRHGALGAGAVLGDRGSSHGPPVRR
jgi:hypothetical protein